MHFRRFTRLRFALMRRRGKRGPTGGFSILEILIAVVIALTFLTALYSSFIQFIQVANRSAARLEALRNARAAISTLTDELKAIGRSGNDYLLVGRNLTAPYGNGIDDDHDGRIDEEVVDGIDNDGDWLPATDDLHAFIPGANPIYDRFMYTTKAPFGGLYGQDADDLGDFHVDEDALFGRDSIIFRIFPSAAIPNFLSRTITYTIGAFDNQNFVLLRQVRTEFTGQPALISTAPLAFGCLGLDLLYWDPNANPQPFVPRGQRPYWVESWNSTNSASFQPPRLPLPASVFARVSVYADPAPFESYVEGSPVETLYMQTVVNIEDTIGDALYPRPSL